MCCACKSVLPPSAARKHGGVEETRRGCLLYDFQVGLTTAVSNRQAFEDNNAMSERTARIWFQTFRSEHLPLYDEARSGRPQVLDDEVLKP